MGIAWSAGLGNCIIYPGDLLIRSADAEPFLGGFERILLYQGIPELPDIYYRAPELRIGDDGDERTLVYALGCLLYEAVEAKPIGLSKKFLSYISERGKYKTSQWLQALPFDSARGGDAGKGTGLQSVITKCLQLNPNQRYQDLVELKGELLHFC
jgi:serine/threonine protein kinase